MSCHDPERRINNFQDRFAHMLSRDSRILCQFPPEFAHTLTKSPNDIESLPIAGAGVGARVDLQPRRASPTQAYDSQRASAWTQGFPPAFTNVTTLNAHQL
jgi:hypothetical protein